MERINILTELITMGEPQTDSFFYTFQGLCVFFFCFFFRGCFLHYIFYRLCKKMQKSKYKKGVWLVFSLISNYVINSSVMLGSLGSHRGNDVREIAANWHRENSSTAPSVRIVGHFEANLHIEGPATVNPSAIGITDQSMPMDSGFRSLDPAPPYPESPSVIELPPTYQAATAGTAHVKS